MTSAKQESNQNWYFQIKYKKSMIRNEIWKTVATASEHLPVEQYTQILYIVTVTVTMYIVQQANHQRPIQFSFIIYMIFIKQFFWKINQNYFIFN